jgi:hypothetical protein
VEEKRPGPAAASRVTTLTPPRKGGVFGDIRWHPGSIYTSIECRLVSACFRLSGFRNVRAKGFRFRAILPRIIQFYTQTVLRKKSKDDEEKYSFQKEKDEEK